MIDGLLQIGEVCRRLGIHPDTVRNHERRGTIRPYRNHAGVRFITQKDFEKLQAMFTPHLEEKEAVHV